MERIRNAFLALLRSGLWGRDPLAEGFHRLSDEQWNLVFRLSGRQTVTGIVFDGICRLPEDLQPSPAIFAQWVVAVDRIEGSNERMNDVLKSLVKLFADNRLNPVLQKGQGVAALYPEPLHRECGDIDFYFPERAENYMAVHLVRNCGAMVETMPDGSQNYEWEGIEIEQHPTIVDLCSPRAGKWLKELDDDPGFIPSTLADGLLVPSPELNALLLNSHILKHTLGKGIGLRQMCDLAMVYHQISGAAGCQECGERIFWLYRRGGILKWSRLVHSFLVDIIGLRKEELPYSERIVPIVPLLRIVEEGGNFGQYLSGGSGRRRGQSASVSVSRRTGQSAEGSLGAVKRKFHTAGMFFRRAGFSLRFAPQEAFWTFMKLAKGQFKK